jgi:formate hydrogenlyase subunit 3/multisubunit Na+/H+ antiporter MnhD subunit
LPSIALLAPLLLPLIAAAIITAFGLGGFHLGSIAAGAGVWAAVLALLVIWLPLRATQELNLGPLGYGSNLQLRIDAVGFAFGLMVLVPAALALTLQARTWQEATVGLLGVAAAMGAVEAGGIVITAIAGGTAATLAVVQLDTEDIRAPRPRWSMLLAAWLALSWAGAILQFRGGTAVYAALPVSALSVPVFSLIAFAGLLASGLFPWRSWPAEVWSRPSLRAAGLVVATLYPLGFYLLVRAYEMGSGKYPSATLNAVLASWGVVVALGAAARAQSAATRRDFLSEVVPGIGGFALMAVALGTPLGLVAGLISLAAASAMTACLSLLPDRTGPPALIAIAAAVGLPPGIVFGSRVLGIESTFEAGDFYGLIGVAAAVAWVLWMVAGARAIGLPGGRGRPINETFPRVAMVIAALTLIAGPALAVFQYGFARVAADVMALSPGTVTGGFTSVVTVSTVLPAVALFVPLLIIGVFAYGAAGTAVIRTQPRPPLFTIPGAGAIKRIREAVAAASMPEQYRTILSLRDLEAAAAGGRPLLWLASLAALGFAVTR